jgi:hypothetical protein
MFGPLFTGVKNPKGPALNQLEKLTFNLSGNTLTLDVPHGNCSMSPNPEGTILPKTNLYDTEQFVRFKKKNCYTTRVIFNRAFTYASFNHPGLGTCRLIVQLVKLDDPQSNLFNSSAFQQEVGKINEYVCDYTNKDQNDDFSKTYPPKSYDLTRIGNEEFLSYQINNYLISEPYYAIPVTSEHYLTLSFYFISVKSGNEPWYLMARELEKKIINSVKLELIDSFQQEKETANS